MHLSSFSLSKSQVISALCISGCKWAVKTMIVSAIVQDGKFSSGKEYDKLHFSRYGSRSTSIMMSNRSLFLSHQLGL